VLRLIHEKFSTYPDSRQGDFEVKNYVSVENIYGFISKIFSILKKHQVDFEKVALEFRKIVGDIE